tara:strand:- start:211 stop:609 length:399 start_codon:yes stop_codon:yes gene_type:complete
MTWQMHARLKQGKGAPGRTRISIEESFFAIYVFSLSKGYMALISDSAANQSSSAQPFSKLRCSARQYAALVMRSSLSSKDKHGVFRSFFCVILLDPAFFPTDALDIPFFPRDVLRFIISVFALDMLISSFNC